jgi:hypothetical protein
MASIANWTSPRTTELACVDFKGCGSVLKEGFLVPAKQRRMQPLLVAQLRNRHVHDEVSAQDGFLLRVNCLRVLSMESFAMPNSLH